MGRGSKQEGARWIQGWGSISEKLGNVLISYTNRAKGRIGRERRRERKEEREGGEGWG